MTPEELKVKTNEAEVRGARSGFVFGFLFGAIITGFLSMVGWLR